MIIHVETLEDKRLEAYVGLTEVQLRNRLEPEKGIFIAESEKVIVRALDAGYEPLSLMIPEHRLQCAPDRAYRNAVCLGREGRCGWQHERREHPYLRCAFR